MNMVFSRPIWSDTQPKNGRVSPFNTRSIASAKVNAGIVRNSSVTGVFATPKSVAMTESCAVAINPPAPTRTNSRYISQNTGSRATSPGRSRG